MSADVRASLLAAEDLRKTYARRVVLDIPSLAVAEGETLALLGSSGAGKSTLLRILGLLERPDAGRVLLDGHDVRAHDRAALRRMAMVFQKPYLFRGTVGENVGYGLRMRGLPAEERRRRVAAMLGWVGLPGWEGRSAHSLSGGEAQRVALARALVVEPSVLLLDEPLSYIDPLLKNELVREFSDLLREHGVTAVWVTHDQDEALVVADRIAIMHEGRILREGAADEVMGLPADEWAAAFVGMEPPLRGRVFASQEGVVEVELPGGARLFAPGLLQPGAEALLGVRPEDVTLFEAGHELPRSSARNRIDGRVADVTPRGALVRVVVEGGEGLRLASLVSRASAAELALAPGTPVAAVFKTAATRVAPSGAGAGGWV